MFCPFKLDPLEILGIHWVFSTQAYGAHTIPLHSNKSLYLPLRKKLAISVSSSPLQTYMSNTFEIQCNSCNPYHKMTIRSLGAKTEKLKNPTGQYKNFIIIICYLTDTTVKMTILSRWKLKYRQPMTNKHERPTAFCTTKEVKK